jgi:large subunit ribosomal protein L6
MSRIGKQPVPLPEGVSVTRQGQTLIVSGKRGELRLNIHPAVDVVEQAGALHVSVKHPANKDERALWGLFRNLIRNMTAGVTTGFVKRVELVGVGYRAGVSGQTLTLNVGFSHPVTITLPEGVAASLEKNVITLEGNDKQIVGEVAAGIRRVRKPEPYKGKGIKYVDEVVRRKAGKAAKAVGK